MNNTYNIQWSERAVNDFNLIVGYLSEKWGEQEIRKFVRLIDKRINQIQSNPGTYPLSSYRSGLHRCVASKIHTIYYLVENDIIYIVTIWDNRSDVRQLKGTLK